MDSRHSDRIEVMLPVLVDTGSGQVPGVVRDLGIDGIYVQTRGAAPVSGRVVVTLDLSRVRETPRQQLRGVVVHRQKDGLGIRLERLANSLRDAVLRCAGLRAAPAGPSVWFVTH